MCCGLCRCWTSVTWWFASGEGGRRSSATCRNTTPAEEDPWAERRSGVVGSKPSRPVCLTTSHLTATWWWELITAARSNLIFFSNQTGEAQWCNMNIHFTSGLRLIRFKTPACLLCQTNVCSIAITWRWSCSVHVVLRLLSWFMLWRKVLVVRQEHDFYIFTFYCYWVCWLFSWFLCLSSCILDDYASSMFVHKDLHFTFRCIVIFLNFKGQNFTVPIENKDLKYEY